MKLVFSVGQIMAFIKIEYNFVPGPNTKHTQDNWMYFINRQRELTQHGMSFIMFDYLDMIPRKHEYHTVISDLNKWKRKLKLIKII